MFVEGEGSQFRLKTRRRILRSRQEGHLERLPHRQGCFGSTNSMFFSLFCCYGDRRNIVAIARRSLANLRRSICVVSVDNINEWNIFMLHINNDDDDNLIDVTNNNRSWLMSFEETLSLKEKFVEF